MKYLYEYNHSSHVVDSFSDVERRKRGIRSSKYYYCFYCGMEWDTQEGMETCCYHLRRLFNLGRDDLTDEEKYKDPYSTTCREYNYWKAKYEEKKTKRRNKIG